MLPLGSRSAELSDGVRSTKYEPKGIDGIFMDNRVALVTGSSTGLGKAIGLALGQADAKVALNYRNNTTRAKQSFDEFTEAGCQGGLFQTDVTDPDQVNEPLTQIESDLGPVDILVLNATCPQPLMPIEEYDWEFYQTMVDFLIKSPFLLTRGVLNHMKRQK